MLLDGRLGLNDRIRSGLRYLVSDPDRCFASIALGCEAHFRVRKIIEADCDR